MNYVFDVDGTLTPSRGVIDAGFSKWFLNFCNNNNVYLITGSDYAKTLEQVGQDICHSVQKLYNCTGNAVYVKGQLVYRSDFTISDNLRKYLLELLNSNKYELRTGLHIEDRVGLCNFSIVGRNATKEQRQHYVEYDRKNKDREMLVELINSNYPEVEATIGGETGIDIYQPGKDKSQVADVLKPFVFFGDSIYPGGNDYTIATKALKYYNVKSWTETYDYLLSITQ
jgi:phosphomannomutase